MAGADIRRFLHRGLLVIVSPEAGNPTRTPRLHPRWCFTGRFSVDVNADPPVDLHRRRDRDAFGDMADTRRGRMAH